MFATTGAIAALFLSASGASADDAAAPAAPYDERLVFEVFRNGSEFGRHVVSFDRSGEELKVVTDIDLTVRFGPFTPFKYRHDSTELWRGGELWSVDAETLKDGDTYRVYVRRRDGALEVDGTAFDGSVETGLLPSSHWNIGFTDDGRLISTETGKILDIAVEALGVETIEAAGRMVEATRYRMTSDLTVDLWYDSSGRWVKCQFEARGQTVEYVLSQA